MYKERVAGLLNAIDRQCPIGDELRDMCFDLVERGLRHYAEYVNCVYNMETRIAIARFHANDVEEYQNVVRGMDESRRIAHEAAIASVNIIDRLCDKFGVEPIYGGSQDRVAIGDFCGMIVSEYFDDRSHSRAISREEIDQVVEEEIWHER